MLSRLLTVLGAVFLLVVLCIAGILQLSGWAEDRQQRFLERDSVQVSDSSKILSDSIRKLQIRKAALEVKIAINSYRIGIVADSALPAVPEFSMYKACLLFHPQAALFEAIEKSPDVLAQVPVLMDSLMFYQRRISGKIVNNLLLVFGLPIRSRRIEECNHLVFDDSFKLVGKILQNRRLAGLPPDSVNLRGILLQDLKKKISESRQEAESPDDVRQDWNVLRAFCIWRFLPKELGLKESETPLPLQCVQSPALRITVALSLASFKT